MFRAHLRRLAPGFNAVHAKIGDKLPAEFNLAPENGHHEVEAAAIHHVEGACLDRQEVTDIQVHAGISELLLCADGLDHNGKTELRVIGNAGAVRFLAAEAVAHPDL